MRPQAVPAGNTYVFWIATGQFKRQQATICSISRPGYSYQAPLLRDICKATSTLLLSGSAVQVGWTPRHTGIMGNELADAAAKPAAEGSSPGDLIGMSPWSYSHLRSQVRDRVLQERQVWHKPRDDFPFFPSTKLSAIFTLPRHAATCLFQMKLAIRTGTAQTRGFAHDVCLSCI